MIVNNDCITGREAFVPLVLDYFSFLFICCQLMHSLIFTLRTELPLLFQIWFSSPQSIQVSIYGGDNGNSEWCFFPTRWWYTHLGL